MQETDRRLRKLDEVFNGQWGRLMETLGEGDMIELLRQRGAEVDHRVSNSRNSRAETAHGAGRSISLRPTATRLKFKRAPAPGTLACTQRPHILGWTSLPTEAPNAGCS